MKREQLALDVPVACGADVEFVGLLRGHPGRITGDAWQDTFVEWFGLENDMASLICYDYEGLQVLTTRSTSSAAIACATDFRPWRTDRISA